MSNLNNLDSSVVEGQAVYKPFTLAIYDLLVIWFSNSYIWRCPAKNIRQLFAENMSANHLDIGVGTGYFLRKELARTHQQDPRLGLMDLNEHSLKSAEAAIAKYTGFIELYQDNILGDVQSIAKPFDSISINYLLHCIPGTIAEKTKKTLINIEKLASPNAKVFGSTIVADQPNSLAQKLMTFYQGKGIFHNQQDTEAELTKILESRLHDVSIQRIGSVVLFSGRVQ